MAGTKSERNLCLRRMKLGHLGDFLVPDMPQQLLSVLLGVQEPPCAEVNVQVGAHKDYPVDRSSGAGCSFAGQYCSVLSGVSIEHKGRVRLCTKPNRPATGTQRCCRLSLPYELVPVPVCQLEPQGWRHGSQQGSHPACANRIEVLVSSTQFLQVKRRRTVDRVSDATDEEVADGPGQHR